jgi:phenylalanyl-tRNA synthetase beta chain
LSAFQYADLRFEAKTVEYYHPGRSASAVVDGVTVAQFGQLHPQTAALRKLRQDVFLAEFSLDLLYQHELRDIRYRALPRYPAVARDFSFIFPDSVLFENIHHAVNNRGIEQLRTFAPVEVFRGGSVPSGKYSLLLRATFQSAERTLREDEVAQWSASIARALEGLGGTQRA